MFENLLKSPKIVDIFETDAGKKICEKNFHCFYRIAKSFQDIVDIFPEVQFLPENLIESLMVSSKNPFLNRHLQTE